MSGQIEWRVSSFCANGACVAVAKDGEGFLVRDTKQADGPVLQFTADEWTAFVAAVKNDEFWSN